MRLLPGENCLIVFDQGEGSIVLYLERVQNLGPAIRRTAYKKTLQKDKIGDHVLLTYDETKRTLAVSGKLQVSTVAHLLVIDDR
jgi:hypothetical protein